MLLNYNLNATSVYIYVFCYRIKYGGMKSKNMWIKFKVKGDPSIEMAALGVRYEPGQN